METCPPSSGSAEALIGITRMSVQSLQVSVLLDWFDVLVIVVVVVRVTFLIPLHSLFMVPLRLVFLLHLHLVHVHLRVNSDNTEITTLC